VKKATRDELKAVNTRFERKFPLDFRDLGIMLARVRQTCLRDPEFPVGQVNSLYFDTYDLEQYHRSDNGEYRKDKVRLRWYGDHLPAGGEVPVFLEVKHRRGFAGSKRRSRLMIPVEKLAMEKLNEGILTRVELMEELGRLGYFSDKPLRPVIYICYQRQRFYEILTNTRISHDVGIQGTVIAPDLLPGQPLIRLPGGVLEIKGPTMEIPVSLRQRLVPDIRWSRFSKYGLLLDAHFNSVTRTI